MTCSLVLTACDPKPEESDQTTAPPVRSVPPEATPAPRTEPTTGAAEHAIGPLRAVVVGVLDWTDPGLADFSPHHRKDVELAETLAGGPVASGADGPVRLLIDRDATADAMWAAIRETAPRTPPGGTFIFYYAGHGVRGETGDVLFANVDLDPNDTDGSGFRVEALADAIANGFEGARVLLLADCCYSGALVDVAAALEARGIASVALTSAEASNLSTGNWTFTQTVLDALQGDSLCDRDADGGIEIGELDLEIADAMKHREHQRHGFARHDVGADYGLADAGHRAAEGQSGGARRAGDYVVAIRGGRGQAVARVRSVEPDVTVRFFDYADATDATVPAATVTPIVFRRYEVGSKQKVYWGGRLYDAEILKVDGDFHWITYPGWPDYWNEWVMSDRILASDASGKLLPKVGAAVQVEWKGKWWDATALEVTGERAMIHYDGFDASWDEWVGPDRIRARPKSR